MPISRSDYLSDIWQPGQFKNRVVFSTGGAGTICSACIRALVDLGANACIVGRGVEKTESVAKEIAAVRPDARVLGIGNIDVRNPVSLQEAADRCARELGGIDIVLVGAAGNFLAPITQLSTNAFKSVIDIDVLGSYNTVRATLPHLQSSATKARATKGPCPKLLFVSATIHYTGSPMQAHVSAAKAAVDALSSACAIELGPRGITSNVIAPGGIKGTEGLERLIRQADLEEQARASPLGRIGTVKDVADATVWICGSSADFINGATLVVDGGAWRVTAGNPGGKGFRYPDFLLSGEAVSGVKSGKQSKL